MFMKEVWKDIPEFEGLYEVSNFGRIRSVDRFVDTAITPTNKRLVKGKIKKTFTLFGYEISNLYKNGKSYNIRVHRIVAKVFCDDYFEGCEVHHKDNNRKNNRSDNLSCSTKMEHLKEHGKGLKRVKKVDKFGNETIYDGIRLAAKLNNVSHQSIIGVLKNKRPSCVGCKWYYVD